MVAEDPYKVLNLPHSANASEIKRSYHQLARKFHPDTWSEPCFSDAEKQQATQKFAQISNAYALLSDEKEKAEYDRVYKYGGYNNNNNNETSAQSTRPTTAPTSPPPPPRAPYNKATTTPSDDGVWASAVDPSTGRQYYYNKSTGRAAQPPPPGKNGDYRRMQDINNNNPPFASRHRADNHQCAAFCSLMLCPPIGMIAMYHSIYTDRCWNQGSYGQATNHSRQAPKYACLGNVIGVLFWIYWLFLREESRFELPDFDFDFDWDKR